MANLQVSDVQSAIEALVSVASDNDFVSFLAFARKRWFGINSDQALFDSFNGQNLITRSMFPAGGAGDYSYAQATQLYGSLYQLREPNKTFRLTVSTTF